MGGSRGLGREVEILGEVGEGVEGRRGGKVCGECEEVGVGGWRYEDLGSVSDGLLG